MTLTNLSSHRFLSPVPGFAPSRSRDREKSRRETNSLFESEAAQLALFGEEQIAP